MLKKFIHIQFLVLILGNIMSTVFLVVEEEHNGVQFGKGLKVKRIPHFYNLLPILWISFTMCSISSLLGFGTAWSTILKKLASPL